MTKIKDLDKRADKIISDLESYGNMTSEWKLNLLKEEVTRDYNQVKDHCSHEYTQKITKIILLLDKHLRNL